MSQTSRGKNLLLAIKDAAGTSGPQLTLKVGQMATLRPVATRRAVQRQNDVRCLTEWRNRHVSAFLTEFVATEERTAAWLENDVGTDECHILFMVDDVDGNTVGYMGLGFIDWNRKYGEADAVVRGLDTAPGLMRAALQTLLEWARGQLELTQIGVRVRSDNPALSFYRKIGFVETQRIPLGATRDNQGAVTWHQLVGAADGRVFLIFHVLGADSFAKSSTPTGSTNEDA